MANISDLNPSDPSNLDPVSGGAQEIRDVKNALVGDGTAANGSFTSNFTGQYTGTADELNGVATSLQDGVSTLDQLADVAYVPAPANGDILVWQNIGWLPKPQISAGSAIYNGITQKVGDQVVFTSGTNNIDPALATIANPASGRGWELTAQTDIELNLALQAYVQWAYLHASGSYLSNLILGAGIALNSASTAFSFNAGIGSDYVTLTSPALGLGFVPIYQRAVATTNIVLAAGDTIHLCTQTSNNVPAPNTLTFTANDAMATMTVRAV